MSRYINKKWRDRFGRVLAQLVLTTDRFRIRMGALNFLVEREYVPRTYPPKVNGWSILLRWNSAWLKDQPLLPPPCEVCGRQVKHPCRNADIFHTEGPWDFCCDEFFNPHRYE